MPLEDNKITLTPTLSRRGVRGGQSEPKTLLKATWVVPISSPPLRDGAVVFEDGQITALGASGQLLQEHPDATIHQLGDAAILPGLINAHTHLEFSGCAAGDSPTSFPDWILSLAARIGPARDFAANARLGAAESINFGVTCVGDISQHCHLTRGALRDGPLRVVSFGEAIGIGANKWKVNELLAQAGDASAESAWLTIGISPHAPYSLAWPDYLRVVREAMSRNLPLATHLAEQPYERDFLANRSGPFRNLIERIGIWEETIETFPGGPIEQANAAGILDYPTILAHVNYCDDAELEILAAGKASVVYCPRTHRYFGHPPHRWREMFSRGINVAVGTDSCASSPDLNLVDDLRLLHEIAPEVSAHSLWEMVTTRAARAMQMDDRIGSLSVGKEADAAVFPVKSGDPLLEILESQILPGEVWIRGQLRTPS